MSVEYDRCDPKTAPDFGDRTKQYIEQTVLQSNAKETLAQRQQMLYSSLVILFRFLKSKRMQDTLGQLP